MKKLLLLLLIVPMISFGQTNAENVYSDTKRQISQILPKIKSSLDNYNKYYSLVDWDDELKKLELKKTEYNTVKSKIDKLELLYNESIKTQEKLIDSINNIIKTNIPKKEQIQLLDDFEKNYFNLVRMSRPELQKLELRTRFMFMKNWTKK